MLPAYNLTSLYLLPYFSLYSPGQLVVPGPERVITDIKDIKNGVELDFTYCEPHTVENPFPSSPGCPKSDTGNPWVVYGSNSPRCYLTGTPGPCGEKQTLVVDKGQLVGYCMCDCLWNDLETDPIGYHPKFCRVKNNMITEYVFAPIYKACFRLYDQGPCRWDEWLAKSKQDGELQCERRLCPPGELLKVDLVKDNQTQCGPFPVKPVTFNFAISIAENEKNCMEGEVLNIAGICVKTLKKGFFGL